ncbi:hypothetical protein P167DRAFT_583378 [Morchella conica CCBAS932]|uniref:Uncharacterized protein n=1 Tax=Morchella conica CCBAS932 TaxID=1392247 RepID=A0A3N4KZ12_9PEZI|nr:hypothetical protein P167DRAFT_583378 [Morchella conica CCBAS932]
MDEDRHLGSRVIRTPSTYSRQAKSTGQCRFLVHQWVRVLGVNYCKKSPETKLALSGTFCLPRVPTRPPALHAEKKDTDYSEGGNVAIVGIGSLLLIACCCYAVVVAVVAAATAAATVMAHHSAEHYSWRACSLPIIIGD